MQADALETETSGNSGLAHDDISNQYRYNWATPSAGCYVLFLSFDTGQVQQAYFNLRNEAQRTSALVASQSCNGHDEAPAA